jgi:hypothetical protein
LGGLSLTWREGVMWLADSCDVAGGVKMWLADCH